MGVFGVQMGDFQYLYDLQICTHGVNAKDKTLKELSDLRDVIDAIINKIKK